MKTSKLLVTVTFILLLTTVSCDEDGHIVVCPVCRDNLPVTNLDVDVIDGYIYANLMPPVIPDPVSCRLTLTVENRSSKYTYSGVTIPSALVYLSSGNRLLGEIFFETDWDGLVRPGVVDTVVVTKIMENLQIFTPPCGDDLYMKIVVSSSGCQKLRIKSPDYRMECVY